MPTIRQLKRRITSVQNTAKITNALQLVAASKMRRAQDRATQGRPYAEKIQGVCSTKIPPLSWILTFILSMAVYIPKE